MPDKDAGTPRVFLIRHGETEWTQSGRYTGSTDIPLTSHGEDQVRATACRVVGHNRIIDPTNLARIYISPRQRARSTFKILFGEGAMSDILEDKYQGKLVRTEERVREWEYGLYEGKLTKEIREMRKAKGLDTEREWNIWTDGCEEGESAAQVSDRLDEVIREIREIQGEFLDGKEGRGPRDVVVFAHGHSLRAFAKRWCGWEMGERVPLMLEPGAVGILSYEHKSVEEPALLLGVNLGGGQI